MYEKMMRTIYVMSVYNEYDIKCTRIYTELTSLVSKYIPIVCELYILSPYKYITYVETYAPASEAHKGI